MLEYWNTGMLEYWNRGTADGRDDANGNRFSLGQFQHPQIPASQHPSILDIRMNDPGYTIAVPSP